MQRTCMAAELAHRAKMYHRASGLRKTNAMDGMSWLVPTAPMKLMDVEKAVVYITCKREATCLRSHPGMHAAEACQLIGTGSLPVRAGAAHMCLRAPAAAPANKVVQAAAEPCNSGKLAAGQLHFIARQAQLCCLCHQARLHLDSSSSGGRRYTCCILRAWLSTWSSPCAHTGLTRGAKAAGVLQQRCA